MSGRDKLLVFHRYLGLSIAAFLVFLGLTGSIIAFQHRLEIALNPELFSIEEIGGKRLSASELIARIEASDPWIRVNYLPIAAEVEQALVTYVEPRINPLNNQPYDLNYDEVFINPVTGEIKGRRMWGECCFERQNIIPLIYKLHNRLALPKPWGSRLLGVVGLIWVSMSLVGIYLTFPRGGRFLKAWKNSWRVQWRQPWRVKNLQLHKSIGLWCWLLMLSSGLSGLLMNLEEELFNPLVTGFSSYSDLKPVDESGLVQQAVDASTAIKNAVTHAKANHLASEPSALWYSSATNVYRVKLGMTGLGPSTFYVGGGSGAVLAVIGPAGETAADFLAALRLPLHSGQLAGAPGPILVSLTGLMTALLAILGVSLWLRKRIQASG